MISNAQVIALIALAACSSLGGKIFEIDFSLVYLFQAFSYLMTAFCVLAMADDHQSLHKESLSLGLQLTFLWQTLKESEIIMILIGIIAVLEIYANFMMSYIQGTLSEAGMSQTAIASVIGGVTLMGLIGAYLARFLQNLRLERVIRRLGLLFLAGILLVSMGQKSLVLMGYTLVNLLVDLAYPYINDQLNQNIENNVRASILSFYSTVVSCILLVIFPLFGWVLDHVGYQLGFLGIGLLLFVILLYFYIKNHQRSST